MGVRVNPHADTDNLTILKTVINKNLDFSEFGVREVRYGSVLFMLDAGGGAAAGFPPPVDRTVDLYNSLTNMFPQGQCEMVVGVRIIVLCRTHFFVSKT